MSEILKPRADLAWPAWSTALQIVLSQDRSALGPWFESRTGSGAIGPARPGRDPPAKFGPIVEHLHI